MRDYVEALLANDFAAAAENQERMQATQDQAVDGQSARKWGTITGVLSLFIFATITPWGQSAMQKLKSMGKLPVGLAELHQKALAKVKLAKYHGQERVRAMITQALLKKARGEKVKSLVILGEPGTGKSALVIQIFYEFSRKYPEEAKKLGLLKGDITEINKELGIVGADSRVADAFWKTVFRKGMVTFIDEIHRLQGLGSHSGSPIAQFNEGAKEGLEQRLGFVIGASTPDEWARFQEDDKAFAQRFDVVYMDSITVDQRLDMLRDQAREIRKEKNRIFSDAALRFIMDNYVTLEPDKHPNRGSKDVLLSIDMQLDAEGYTKKEVGLDDIEAAFAKIVEARQKAKFESLVGKIKAALQKVRDDTGIQPDQIGFSSTADYENLSKKEGEEWYQAFSRLNTLLTLLNAMPTLMSENTPEEVIALVRAAVEQAKRSATPSSSRRSGPASSGAPASPPPEPFDETQLGIRSQELYSMIDYLPSPRDPSLETLLENLRTIYAKKDGESEADRIARLNPIEGAIHTVLYRNKKY
jgi:ATP-dependent Clp protease ATP-binding subunit ClpA